LPQQLHKSATRNPKGAYIEKNNSSLAAAVRTKVREDSEEALYNLSYVEYLVLQEVLPLHKEDSENASCSRELVRIAHSYLCPQHVARDETRELLRGKAPCASSSLISPCTICSSRGHRDMKRSFLVQVGLLADAFKSSDALRKRFLNRPQED
jgi:hypothetical protein